MSEQYNVKIAGSDIKGGCLTLFFMILVIMAVSVSLAGWFVMLLFGVVHSIFPASIPAIGYPISCGLGLLINLVFGRFHSK